MYVSLFGLFDVSAFFILHGPSAFRRVMPSSSQMDGNMCERFAPLSSWGTLRQPAFTHAATYGGVAVATGSLAASMLKPAAPPAAAAGKAAGGSADPSGGGGGGRRSSWQGCGRAMTPSTEFPAGIPRPHVTRNWGKWLEKECIERGLTDVRHGKFTPGLFATKWSARALEPVDRRASR